MRRFFGLAFSALVLAGCGGGDAVPPPVPVGSVSGITFDGLVRQGDIKVYDFSTGKRGALLASARTNDEGLYNLSLQIESRPVWLELTGGEYKEERDGVTVALKEMHKLVAVANYKTGEALTVAVTTHSYVAAGLAQYKISKGAGVVAAVNDANSRISKIIGVNILNTIPKQITDVANQSATLTPELSYGFLAGAISKWTFDHAPTSGTIGGIPVARRFPYNSIDFAQSMYQDVVADGLLDGFGLDASGAAKRLSFGLNLLGPDVYRYALGVEILQMSAHANNKTGVTPLALVPFATEYAGSVDDIYTSSVPAKISAGAVSRSGFGVGTSIGGIPFEAHIQFSAETIFGIKTIDLLVDGVKVASAVHPFAPTDATYYVPDQDAGVWNYLNVADSGAGKQFRIGFSTKKYEAAIGFVHKVDVRMTNGVGLEVSMPTLLTKFDAVK